MKILEILKSCSELRTKSVNASAHYKASTKSVNASAHYKASTKVNLEIQLKTHSRV